MSDDDYNYDEELNEGYDDDGFPQAEDQDILPPNDFKKQLQACINCQFLLTKIQWGERSNCPNCNYDIKYSKPTAKYTGITCITNPNLSWQTQRMRITKQVTVRVPGAYAISINDDVERDYQNFEN